MKTQDFLINDIHSQLNETRVSKIVKPSSVEEVSSIIVSARSEGKAVSIMGGRHAMGGQQFGIGTILLDMTGMNKVIGFDNTRGLIEVEAGIEWPALIKYLSEAQKDQQGGWAIVQKQTGADNLTIGGSLAANVHGRGLKLKPIIADVESLTVINDSGKIVLCSRKENKELFGLVIGGYGLFGVITAVTLRLTKKEKLMRVVEIINVDDLIGYFDKRIADGFHYGDFQFSTDRATENFLTQGVFSCYKPVPQETPQATGYKELSQEDWIKLYALGHSDHKKAYELYTQYYLSTSGQVYDSDTHQLSYYPEGYHAMVDKAMNMTTKASEMITEIYVPRNEIASFMNETADHFRKNDTEVFYGTVRIIEKDEESFLVWAKQPYICIIFNLHIVHNEEGFKKAEVAFRDLIDSAIKRGGSYYLTYHRWARRDQIEACYPQFIDFLKLKKKYDPKEVFQSEWYRHYKTMFADRL